jgi:hypothetical protein
MQSRPSLRTVTLLGCALALLAGCSTTGKSCGGNEEYLKARERPPLQMPEGVTGSERVGGTKLVIPPVSPTPDKLDPAPKCLDDPPGFFKRATAGAPAGSAEEAVNVWAYAWSARKADQVASFYSQDFQPADGGDSAVFIAQLKQQVVSGQAPAAKLEQVTAQAQGPDRQVITFVQRFGDRTERRELTLVREPTGWRIVAERTLAAP